MRIPPPLDPVRGWPAWKAAWADVRFRWVAVGSLVVLVATMAAFASFVAWVEERPGAVLADPVVERLAPADLNVPTFALIYGSLLLGIAILLPRPRALSVAMRAYVLVVWVRALVMWLAPLDPPAGIVPLLDPLVEGLGTGRGLTRDLFFSGHVATGFVVFLCCPVPIARVLLLLATVAVGFLTLKQHVHYTIDVLVAPFVAYGAYRVASRFP